MDRETARKKAILLNAYANGETIQTLCISGDEEKETWSDCSDPEFDGDMDYYRVKHQPISYPFSNGEELLNEMQKHQPIGWIKNTQGTYLHIDRIDVKAFKHSDYDEFIEFKYGFDYFEFADGSVFGLTDKEEK